MTAHSAGPLLDKGDKNISIIVLLEISFIQELKKAFQIETRRARPC